MTTNKQSPNGTDDRAAYTFSVPKDYRKRVKTLQQKYGYRREADAAFNLMRVGLQIFERNPEEYLKLLATN